MIVFTDYKMKVCPVDIMKSLLALILLIIVPLHPSSAQKLDDLKPKTPITTQAEDSEQLNWAVSFGTTQLFENWFGESNLNLPVSSATLMLARHIHKRIKTWVIFNLPLVPSQRINQQGQASFSPNPPVVLLGASVVFMDLKLKREKRLEGEFGIYGGKVLENQGLYFPLAAGRLALVKKDDVAIYLGLSASIRVDTLGLIYGVEHRF